MNFVNLEPENFERVYNREAARKIHRTNIAIFHEPNIKSKHSKIKQVVVGPMIIVAK